MENQNQVGRPTVITEGVVAKLIECFKLGGSDTLACSYAGIDPSTFYRHMENDLDFATKIKSAKTYIEIVARSNVVKEIESGNLKASQWWLERRVEEFELHNKELEVDKSKLSFDERLREMLK